MKTIRDYAENGLFWCGVFSSIVGVVGRFADIMADPLYSLVLQVAGVVMLGIYTSIVLFTTHSVESPIVESSDGSRIKSRTSLYSVQNRLVAGVALVVAGMFVLNSWASRRSDLLALADNSRVQWLSDGTTVHSEDGDDTKYRAAYVTTDFPPTDPTDVYPASCAFQFDVSKRPRLPWVSLERIEIEVLSYKPPPEKSRTETYSTTFRRVPLYLVEIENPSRNGRSIFKPRVKVSPATNAGGNRPTENEPHAITITDNLPFDIAVRVAAKTSGVYSFNCYVTVRYKDETQRIKIFAEPQTWLFLVDPTPNWNRVDHPREPQTGPAPPT